MLLLFFTIGACWNARTMQIAINQNVKCIGLSCMHLSLQVVTLHAALLLIFCNHSNSLPKTNV